MFYYPAGTVGKQGIEIPVRIIVLIQIFRGFGFPQFKKISGAGVAGNPLQISRTEQDIAGDATRSVLMSAYGAEAHKKILPRWRGAWEVSCCLLSAAFRLKPVQAAWAVAGADGAVQRLKRGWRNQG